MSQPPSTSIKTTTNNVGPRLATSVQDRESTTQQRNRRYINAVHHQPMKEPTLRAKVILGSAKNVIPAGFAKSLGPAYNATGFLPSVY